MSKVSEIKIWDAHVTKVVDLKDDRKVDIHIEEYAGLSWLSLTYEEIEELFWATRDEGIMPI